MRVFEYNGKKMDFTRPRVMGIVNLTPDSFYDGSSASPPVPLSKLERGNRGKGVKGVRSGMAWITELLK